MRFQPAVFIHNEAVKREHRPWPWAEIVPILLFLMSAPVYAQQQHISGSVRADQGFTHDLGRGLVLVVTTSSIAIQAAPGREDADNYASCVTPPFHGLNALDIEPWHFDPAQVQQSPGLKREFQFAMTPTANKEACEELTTELYGQQTAKGSKSGHSSRRGGVLGSGVLTLSKVQVSPARSGKDATIQSFAFEADITLAGPERGRP